MKFILTLFFIYITFRFISYLVIRILAYKIRKSTGGNNENTMDSTEKNKKKVFRHDEGEYVDFEEIDKNK